MWHQQVSFPGFLNKRQPSSQLRESLSGISTQERMVLLFIDGNSPKRQVQGRGSRSGYLPTAQRPCVPSEACQVDCVKVTH